MAFVPLVVPLPVISSRGSVCHVNHGSRYYYNNYPHAWYGSPYHRSYYTGRYSGSGHPMHTSSVLLGPLPPDFLSVPAPPCDPVMQRQQQLDTDHAMAAQLQMMNRTQPVVGRLQITVVRATLHKNYGMTRMDPYARLHLGQQVFETQTDPNGAKNPVWNKTFYIYQLPKSFTSFHLEVYDERTLSDDERIAWVTVPLPQSLLQGEVCDKTYQLSGRLGDNLEGSIHIIMAYETGPAPTMSPMLVYGGAVGYPTPAVQGLALPPVYQLPAHPPMPQPQSLPQLTEEEMKQVCSMFPDVEPEVVASVLEASNNNKEAAVEALLTMQQTN